MFGLSSNRWHLRNGRRILLRVLKVWIIEVWIGRRGIKYVPWESSFLRNKSSSSGKSYWVVTVLSFVCCDHNRGILRWSFHSLLHRAFTVRTTIIAPVIKDNSSITILNDNLIWNFKVVSEVYPTDRYNMNIRVDFYVLIWRDLLFSLYNYDRSH